MHTLETSIPRAKFIDLLAAHLYQTRIVNENEDIPKIVIDGLPEMVKVKITIRKEQEGRLAIC